MKYHNKLMLLFFIIWGVVGLERMVLGFVLPAITEEFKMNLTQAGMVVAAFSFAYAIGTSALGGLSSSGIFGRRPLLVLWLVLGGLFSWLTGMVTGFVSLLLIRIIMGFAHGGIYPCCAPTLLEESPENVRGRNLGLLTTGMFIFGAVIGPILSSQLLVTIGWRPVFFLYAIPAFVLAIITWFVMRETPSTEAMMKARKIGKTKVKALDAEGREISYWSIFKYRNVILMGLFWVCQLAWIWMITSFGVLYIMNFHGMKITQVGLLMSGFGIGAALGAVVFGAVSDRIGRKTTLIFTQLAALVVGSVFVTMGAGTPLIVLFLLLLLWAMLVIGAAAAASTIPAETVGFSMAGAAMGFAAGLGELIGGGIIPIIGGRLGDIFGLRATMWLTVALVGVSVIIALFVKDTKPLTVQTDKSSPPVMQ